MQAGWVDSPHRELALGDFRLEGGGSIRDFRLSYVAHGAPAALEAGSLRESDNVVLALSAIGSTHHRLDFLIGDGKALDPRRTVVLAVDAIGNGLSTSPSNSTLQPLTDFPAFTIRDMVASQLALLDHLGVRRLKAVIGASMGGMQALQWAVSHGARLDRVVAMTPMARTSPWAAAINEASRRALAGGWAAWVPLMQLIAGRTPQQVDQEFGSADAAIEWIRQRTGWWEDQGFDAADWIYQTRAYDAHDVGTSPGFGGDTTRALQSVTLPVLVLAPPLDLYNPAGAARDAAERMPGARFVEIPSTYGHQSASAADADAADFLNRVIGEFLAR
jgi:homoserine O-acetyltransferase